MIITVKPTDAQAQTMKYAPQRAAANLYGNQHTLEIVKETEVKKCYPNGISPSSIVVKIVDKKGGSKVFQCTQEEYEFLQNQLKKWNLQLIFDDEIFVGFTKIIIY
jgi:hypothetical protein